ncbi:putative 149 kDa protein [Dissostichus eleginoides]|uniref:149 kDa protein n=1 Tax=Dissostichus eleginoides TaxID=100907 RepID=A0AAD9FMG6_DISEL|nr:putative 149 kDa protein [Dissostichus eleginoides]
MEVSSRCGDYSEKRDQSAVAHCSGSSESRWSVDLVLCGVGPSLQQRLCEERILTLGQVVEVCGPRLDNAAGLASRLSLRSVRVVSLLLQSWKQQLSQSELALIAAHCNGLKSPNDNDSFPEMRFLIFKRMVKARLKTDYSYFCLTKNVGEFEGMWCLKNALCSVENEDLIFSRFLN